VKCIVCGKNVPELAHFTDDDPPSNCWDGGIVEWVAAGYGSIHDCSRFLICICDDCVTTKRAAGVITN
jgi:hypothetical protein